MNSNKKPNRETIILALALVKHLYNKEEIPEHVYKNIKRECESKIKKSN